MTVFTRFLCVLGLFVGGLIAASDMDALKFARTDAASRAAELRDNVIRRAYTDKGVAFRGGATTPRLYQKPRLVRAQRVVAQPTTRVWHTEASDTSNFVPTVTETATYAKPVTSAVAVTHYVFPGACEGQSFNTCVRSTERRVNNAPTKQYTRTLRQIGYQPSVEGVTGQQTSRATTAYVVQDKTGEPTSVMRAWYADTDGSLHGLETQAPVAQRVEQATVTQPIFTSFQVRK